MTIATPQPELEETATLAEFLKTPHFRHHCLFPLVHAANFAAGMVNDEQALNSAYRATDDATYKRAVGFASVLRAAIQWFIEGEEPKPEFVGDAMRYLAEHQGESQMSWFEKEPPDGVAVTDHRELGNLLAQMPRGIVVHVKGEVGQGGRLAGVLEHRAVIAKQLGALTGENLDQELQYYEAVTGDAGARRTRTLLHDGKEYHLPVRSLPEDLARDLSVHFVTGHGYGQILRPLGGLPADFEQLVSASIYRVLLHADLAEAPDRDERMKRLAEDVIRAALLGAGLEQVPKDLFRDRRGEP